MSETKTEQKAAHTPGPWRIWQQVDPAIEQPSAHVALVNTTFVVGSGPLGAPEADARLIAAAPTLLEALEDAAAILGNVLLHHGVNMSASDLAARMAKLDEFEAAIASARGEG